MAKVINVFKVLRNNWKKSIFFSGLAAWGGSYARKQYMYVVVEDVLLLFSNSLFLFIYLANLI